MVVNILKVENVIDGLETKLTRIASTAVACPDENDVYAISNLPLKDTNIHYSQFTDMERKSESKFFLLIDFLFLLSVMFFSFSNVSLLSSFC